MYIMVQYMYGFIIISKVQPADLFAFAFWRYF
jgi:hypothetical protein